MSTIVICGATGNVGSALLELLDRRAHTVRGLARHLPARPLGGVDYRVGDLGDARVVDAALRGADAVFVACASSPRQVELESLVIDGAARHDVGNVVKLSAFGAAADAPVAFWRWHAQIEDHLETSGLPHTVLRPYFFMSNLLPALGPARASGLLLAPAGRARVAMTDPRDVAAVAARALTAGSTGRSVVTLTGPEALDHGQVAQAMTRALDRPVTYQDVGEEAARDHMVRSGLPGFAADQVLAVYACLREGMQSHADVSVWRCLGRDAHTIDDYLRGAVAQAALLPRSEETSDQRPMATPRNRP